METAKWSSSLQHLQTFLSSPHTSTCKRCMGRLRQHKNVSYPKSIAGSGFMAVRPRVRPIRGDEPVYSVLVRCFLQAEARLSNPLQHGIFSPRLVGFDSQLYPTYSALSTRHDEDAGGMACATRSAVLGAAPCKMNKKRSHRLSASAEGAVPSCAPPPPPVAAAAAAAARLLART